MARSRPARPAQRPSLARQAGIAALFVIAAVLGIVTGVVVAYSGDLPQVSALDQYSPGTITRIYASDNRLIGEFATQRRVMVKYEEIPLVLRQAILSAEDGNFEEHFGIDFTRTFVRVLQNLVLGRSFGGSTLTQQLARKLFLKPEKSLERKVKEWLLAIQIEKRYTKHEIFTMYCNQMNLGHGAYGVEAASRLYFGKPIKDLKLEEAALVAGILQLPERESPFVNQKWAMQRRNYALQRMADEHYITQADADAAKARPIVVVPLSTSAAGTAPYFVEEVRKYLEHRYGARDLYEAGMSVYTTLDVDLQREAARALDRGLRQIDKRRGFRKPARNLTTEHVELDAYRDRRWDRPIQPGDIVPGLVIGAADIRERTPVTRRRADTAPPSAGGAMRVRVGRYEADLTRTSIQWTGRTRAADLVRPGDLIEVEVLTLDEPGGRLTVRLEQFPIVEGAVLVIDNRTGQIKAMVGGSDFARSKFNRAVQAPRQIGSAFKPIVFTAAIDRGYTPSSLLLDAPVSYHAGPGQPPYAPRNYDRKYEGSVTLRRTIEDSRNVPTVRMMEQLTPEQVISYARQLGFQSPIRPYLSSALGASEATLLEVTSAYSAFPNQGVRMQPFQILKIVERDGTLLEEHRPQATEGIRADTAFVMVNLLRGVVLRGTGAKAAELDWPLAGKTGTVDDYTDAWFVGFDPNLTIGVWVGLDEKKPIGANETGAVAALPIWMEIFKSYIDRQGDRNNPPRFDAPGNIVFMAVDPATGLPVNPETPGAINEAYIAGTQPGIGFPKQ
ncbi:MAG: PBP1A family penicillin-binding protein [Acidobacteria bacterium]|nr:PBP1A family penicillin-binding protein [Acidobacteriota bacterium]